MISASEAKSEGEEIATGRLGVWCAPESLPSWRVKAIA